VDDPYDLNRFVKAQDAVYAGVVEELRAGWKRGHWMWFIFPQIRGLGHSPMAERYAIGSREEAEPYLKHAVLGPRLRECTRLVVEVKGRTVQEIFGFPDDLKFRSCITLFAHATDENGIFKEAVEKYFGGEWDGLTIAKMRK